MALQAAFCCDSAHTVSVYRMMRSRSAVLRLVACSKRAAEIVENFPGICTMVRVNDSRAALQPDGALPADRAGLNHVAIAGSDELRDHPGMGEINLIDRIPGAIADDALRQRELPEIGLQKRKRIIWQDGEKAVCRRSGQAAPLGPGHRPVCQ